jgi:hypothetical protein
MLGQSLIPLLIAISGTTAEPPALVAEPEHDVAIARESKATSFRIRSALLDQTRQVRVALPESFERSAPDRRYPVTVVLDGAWLLTKVAAASDELARNGLIPESILVAIENVDDFDGRVHDLTPPGLSVSGSSLNEGGDRFLDFIERELLPAVDRKFRGAPPRTLVGTSSGGILATWAAATRPSFRAVVALDTPIHLDDEWLAKKLTARAQGETAPLRYASYEVRFGWSDAAWSALVAKAPASWLLHREKIALEGHETMQLVGAYLGLREVFRDYSRFAAPVSPTTSTVPYYEELGRRLGAPVIPPRRLVSNVVEDLLMEGKGAAARQAYELLVRGYGAPEDGDKLLARIAEVEKRPPPTETVEGLLATPFPSPEDVRAYVGEWTGETWMNDRAPRQEVRLRITIEDGRVVGETIHPQAPAEYRVQRWEYLRVTQDGITWGNMNGMRPRGVILFEAKRDGETLAGQTRWGGIDFRREDGSPTPQQSFTFRRSR